MPSLSESALMALRLPSMDKAALLAPGAVARVAARGARRPEERWLLHQARPVRASYVAQVLESPGEPNVEDVWMLRQPKPVRESYIREVLAAPDEPNAEDVWMLRQPKPVRESYIREVLGG